MKKYIMLAAVLFFLSSPSHAFQNEPDNFRGVAWGANLEAIPGMTTLTGMQTGNDKIYIKKGDKLSIGDAVLEVVTYGAYKGKFYSVFIKFNGFSNFVKLREVLFQQYGNGDKPNRFMDNYNWRGAVVRISLNYNEISNQGTILYTHIPTLDEIKLDRSAKAKDSAGDL